MFPTLIELGPLAVPGYGFFLGLAFVLFWCWMVRQARRCGRSARTATVLSWLLLGGAILGARLFYVAINLPFYRHDPWQIPAFWDGGLVFSGGLIMGSLLGLGFLRNQGQPVLAWADLAAPGLALAQAVGRIGCFAAGCCYGELCAWPIAVTFRHPESLAHPLGLPLHPTQLYHAAAGAMIFAVLAFARTRVHGAGRLFGLYLVLYAPTRLLVEVFRADPRGLAGPVSATAWTTMGLLLLGSWLVARNTKGE